MPGAGAGEGLGTVGAVRAQVTRTAELWKLFRNEGNDPGAFYRRLAADAVDGFERRYGALTGKRVADVGAGNAGKSFQFGTKLCKLRRPLGVRP